MAQVSAAEKSFIKFYPPIILERDFNQKINGSSVKSEKSPDLQSKSDENFIAFLDRNSVFLKTQISFIDANSIDHLIDFLHKMFDAVKNVFIPEPIDVKGWLQKQPVSLSKIESSYGPAARQRFMDWQKLMDTGKNIPERDKLQQVNDFFNQRIQFIDDLILWKKEDYWATPIECLAKGAGDCEDFAIAKYFTLLEMAVDDRKLRITYTRALRLNAAHMVLAYYAFPHAIPEILDNLQQNIRPATERTDLLPIYNFNLSQLWIQGNLGSGKQNVPEQWSMQPFMISDHLKLWADLKRRMLEPGA